MSAIYTFRAALTQASGPSPVSYFLDSTWTKKQDHVPISSISRCRSIMYIKLTACKVRAAISVRKDHPNSSAQANQAYDSSHMGSLTETCSIWLLTYSALA